MHDHVMGENREKPQATYYHGLDAIRFSAAFLVMLIHFNTRAIPAALERGASTSEISSTAAATWFGYLGVEIFFVLSGLVIANSANGETPGRFLVSRFLRLYPAAWVCATISLVFIVWGGRPISREFGLAYLSSVTLFPNYGKIGWIDTVYWTLPVEMIFYSCVFFLLANRRFVLLPALAAILTAWSGIYISLVALMHTHTINPIPFVELALSHVWLQGLTLLRHGVFFGTGLWIWLIVRSRVTIPRLFGLTACVTLGAAEVLVRAFDADAKIAVTTYWLPITMWFVAVCLIVIFTRHALSARFRKTASALRNLGLMTYPFYLLHNEVGSVFAIFVVARGGSLALALLAEVLIVGFMSWLICTFSEPAIRRLLRPSLERLLARCERHIPFLAKPGDSLTSV